MKPIKVVVSLAMRLWRLALSAWRRVRGWRRCECCHETWMNPVEVSCCRNGWGKLICWNCVQRMEDQMEQLYPGYREACERRYS